MNKSSLEAAVEAAARVNAMLIAKGKLKMGPSAVLDRSVGDLITAEVEINDAPLIARNLLTRGHTQDEICKFSGAALSTRGRYMTFEDRLNNVAGDRPLYLHVQASIQDSVNLAISRIHEIIGQCSKGNEPPELLPTSQEAVGTVTYSTFAANGSVATMPPPQPAPVVHTGLHFVQGKVFVGLEHAPPTYPVREKVLGPGESYLQHIRTETGATVTLRGRGSCFIEPTSGREAFEPLYVHLTHPKPEGLHTAKTLAVNLVETVHADYAQWQQQLATVAIQAAPHLAYQGIVTPITISSSSVPLANHTVTSVPVVSSIASLVDPATNLPVFTVVSTAHVTTPLYSNATLITPSVVTPCLTQSAIITSQAFNTPLGTVQAQPTIIETVPLVASPAPVFPQQVVVSQSSVMSHSPLASISQAYATFVPSAVPVATEHLIPISTTYPLLKQQHPHKRKFTEEPDIIERHPAVCFKESLQERPMAALVAGKKDRDLMPPPSIRPNQDPLPVVETLMTHSENTRKRFRGALGGLAMIYGSDDSDDEVGPVGSSTVSPHKRYI